ncbi:ETT1 [Candida theae]|uniref:Enhancer of translation termination 1 n=1 Tax=Candida theae TaxID=1198502 RepID=A0AAD5BB29_9ASCO|nr:ETT1 [Candida theae]KAI5949996.1 ETT1 [Candida theae]
MAKRTLGLGKAAKAKKQKTESESIDTGKADEASNQLTVELPEEVDADDEISQLKGLYKAHINSERDNELVVNGIIHECDRLLRNQEEGTSLPPTFYKIYSIALSELANFHFEDVKQVKEFFDASLERIETGLEKYPHDVELLLTRAKILINQLISQHVSQLSLDSKSDETNVKELLDAALKVYESAEVKADESSKFEAFSNAEYFDILEAVDDLLDIVDNFGKNEVEEEEEEEEEEGTSKDDNAGEEEEEIELDETHPLYPIKNTDEYNQWWRDHTIKYLEILNKVPSPPDSLIREVNQRLGQSYLQESEIPTNVYTTLKYDEDYAGLEELEGLTLEQAQEIAKDLIHKALEHLKKAEDKEEPESWVSIAEAMITLGNLYELDSEEQEKLYDEAETILKKANNVTNGKYEDVLENLLAN